MPDPRQPYPPAPSSRPPKPGEPFTMASPFPPGSLPKPKPRRARWGVLGAAVVGLALEVARIWFPALVGPVELARDVVELVQ